MTDAWIAPGGGAVKLSAAAMKMQARPAVPGRPQALDDEEACSALAEGVIR
jgi:hypothetical protein